MIRQLTKCSRAFNFFRIQPQSLQPCTVLAIRCLSDKPPPTNGFISQGAKNILNAKEKARAKPPLDKQMYDDLVRSNKVVVFMKGTPKSPRCGFSNAVVQIFRMHGVPYDAHDVLANDELREGIKLYTDWPTIPHVFIDGEFIGGCDVLLEMHQNGDLVEYLQKAGIESELLRIQKEVDSKNNEKQKDK